MTVDFQASLFDTLAGAQAGPLLGELAGRLAAALHHVPEQDLRVTRHRVPATVRSGMLVEVA